MAYTDISVEKRVKENIKNYRLQNLFDMELLREYLKGFVQLTGLELLLTERHGEEAAAYGDFVGFSPDVVNDPGVKIKIQDRTVGHLYLKWDQVSADRKALVENMVECMVRMFASNGEEAYLHRELAAYLDDMEERDAPKQPRVQYGEHEDALTGVFNKMYFDNRIRVIDRAEVVPVAVILANINDWKFVNDHFGEEESDRLIQTVASLLKQEAKPEYIIGRTDGDVFGIVIPMAADGEAEAYCRSVERACLAYEDRILAPSVAFGYVYKTNVEEKIDEGLSDAEYEMLNRKMRMKSAPGYQDRLRKGL